MVYLPAGSHPFEY